jgi:hypothetical protein
MLSRHCRQFSQHRWTAGRLCVDTPLESRLNTGHLLHHLLFRTYGKWQAVRRGLRKIRRNKGKRYFPNFHVRYATGLLHLTRTSSFSFLLFSLYFYHFHLIWEICKIRYAKRKRREKREKQ